jgi:hypothetical protein
MRKTTLSAIGVCTLMGVLMAATSCKKAKDAAETAMSDDPQTSYCEAVCDWAVGCHEENREIEDGLYDECVSNTEAVNDSCASASAGTLEATDRVTHEECTDAIAEKVDDCSSFTGSLTEQASGTPPAACLTIDEAPSFPVFNEARNTTVEGGDEMCDRFTSTFCEKLTDCLLGDFTLPDAAIKAIGTPQEVCESALSNVTDRCVSEGLYAPGDYSDLTDQNVTREAAEECLDGVDDMGCTDLFSADAYPATCAGSFADADSMLDFVGGMASSACAFKDYISLPDGLCE